MKRAAADGTRKRRARRTGAGAPAANVARTPDRERRFVDVDPWALLLEHLMEVSEEDAPAERKSDKGGAPIPRSRRYP